MVGGLAVNQRMYVRVVPWERHVLVAQRQCGSLPWSGRGSESRRGLHVPMAERLRHHSSKVDTGVRIPLGTSSASSSRPRTRPPQGRNAGSFPAAENRHLGVVKQNHTCLGSMSWRGGTSHPDASWSIGSEAEHLPVTEETPERYRDGSQRRAPATTGLFRVDRIDVGGVVA